MARKKNVEAVAVPDNLSMAFLQRRFDMLLRDMEVLRERGAISTPAVEVQAELDLARELLQRAEEDRETLREQVESLTSAKKELAEKLESEEARNVELEDEKEALEEAVEERFNLLCHAQKALRSVLGREDLEDSLEKFEAFRVLEDITDEVG